jgi:CelD/BcsL family acetyltransferase involved in cellulose biosynthesis
MGEPATLTVEVIDDWGDLHDHLSRWDGLAVACSRPYCSPAWMGAWWLHVAPRRSRLRLFMVFEGSELVGVAPLFADGKPGFLTRYRVLGARCSSSLDLLALPGREAEIASALAPALAGASPRPDVLMLEGIRGETPWPSLLAKAWPGPSPANRPQFSLPAPRLDLRGRSYDEWFSSKSRNFRQNMRRRLRQLERAGATFRLASTHEELEYGLRSFADLHYGRWNWRGGSGVLDRRVERMLLAAGEQLIGANRFRLWSVEVAGQPISSHLFLSAGEETSYWLGGFDEDWARLQVSVLTILAGIEHAFDVGDQRFDLGTGGQEYKYRMADDDTPVHWSMVTPMGIRSPVARMQLLPERARLAVANKLSPDAKSKIRQIRRRVSSLRTRTRT